MSDSKRSLDERLKGLNLRLSDVKPPEDIVEKTLEACEGALIELGEKIHEERMKKDFLYRTCHKIKAYFKSWYE